jgi:transcription elongation GreA/GreB family factor
VDKAQIRAAILAQLESELVLQTEAALTSKDEATNEENKAEDKYDMRSQSAAYLAAGQAKMASEIADAILAYRNLPLVKADPSSPIAAGDLVTLTSRGNPSYYFVGPNRGGMEVTLGKESVTVVTGGSPLGRQLLGRRVGDKAILPARPLPVEYVIEAVS